MHKWIMVILIIAPMITYSQGQQRISEKGLEISYGCHHFAFTKPSGKISDLAPLTKGVSTGFYFGNNLLQTRSGGWLWSRLAKQKWQKRNKNICGSVCGYTSNLLRRT
jgi:hypothetical protein